MNNQSATLAELDRFDTLVDVRTPLEFADDHLPGAINVPVLSDEERVAVGTLYKQAPFEATRYGAALVARNIAHHLDTTFADRPPRWKPLIYCWRGGKRSGSMTAWFNLIGWKARQLEGGYKAYRHEVLARLDRLPGRFDYRVLAGLTGSGKTRLLRALAGRGAQVLDLERLACHRGSLLGALPGEAQPSQKSFESRLAQALAGLDPARPVFVEAESRRIGSLRLPQALMQALAGAACIRVEARPEDRVAFLCQDYAALFADPAAFKQQLARLAELHGRRTVAHWHALVDAGAMAELFAELIERHYDPAYLRSSHGLYARLPQALPFAFRPDAADLGPEADRLLAGLSMAPALAVPGEMA
ncbi:tRNA 2-selenouridine(34) synthase MnmH [Chitinimonas koreensis]|uniref:tRNA 2-selenouridine(34) synthase MnmH n=1 Tax=Chitinimonas koreensis TaxID=356302 RepID=UPI000406F335|nr:tRNA 2-selenouridine(34) synthase MnmH [Chitinimonas koreensis]QNM97610.1 tRNA 2-selenouridine(34) synthase MnmH [Chitinimonas koreensis]